MNAIQRVESMLRRRGWSIDDEVEEKKRVGNVAFDTLLTSYSHPVVRGASIVLESSFNVRGPGDYKRTMRYAQVLVVIMNMEDIDKPYQFPVSAKSVSKAAKALELFYEAFEAQD